MSNFVYFLQYFYYYLSIVEGGESIMKLKVILVISLILNLLLICVGSIELKSLGGIYYLKAKFAKTKILSPYYHDRVSMFKDFDIKEKKNVFVGDSEIDYAELNELFNTNDIANRGIAGDTTDGVANRIDTLKKLNPSNIFILVGINDLQQNLDEKVIMNNYRRIIQEIKTSLPNAKINFLSVMYVNPSFYNQVYMKNGDKINERVKILNSELKSLVVEQNCNFINLNDVLSKSNQLNSKYTTDGLHLNSDGYEQFKTKINLQ